MIKGTECFRFAAINKESVNNGTRTITASLSSETPVSRFYGMEVLKHTSDSCNLDHAKDGLPMLWNHDQNQPIGVVKNVRIDGKRLVGDLIFSNNQKANEIWSDVKEGFLKDISIGYIVDDYEENKEGIIVIRWTLLETSIVSVPADISVGVNRKLEKKMPEESKKEDSEVFDIDLARRDLKIAKRQGAKEAVIHERKRVSDIDNLFSLDAIPRSELFASIRLRAIDEGWKIEEARRITLEVMSGLAEPALDYRMPDIQFEGRNISSNPQKQIYRDANGNPTPIVVPSSNNRRSINEIVAGDDALEKFAKGASQGILVRSGIADKKEDIQAAREGGFVGMSLARLADSYLRLRGVATNNLSDDQLAERAFSTRRAFGASPSDFPAILTATAEKSMLMGWDESPESWMKWTRRGTLPDFKRGERVGLSGFSDLDKIGTDGEIAYGKFTDRAEYIQVSEYAKKFRLNRRTIVNDDLAAFTQVPRGMGRAANRKVGDVVYALLASAGPTMNQDSTLLFDVSTHKNYVSSSGAAPSTASLAIAYTAMAIQKDPNSLSVLNIIPKFLLTPKTLEVTANVLRTSTFDPAGTTNSISKRDAPNPFQNRFEVISDARLDGQSTTAWVLTADPNTFDTIEVAFLNGMAEPALREQEEWDMSGVEYVVRVDFGASVLDYRTMYKNAGAGT